MTTKHKHLSEAIGSLYTHASAKPQAYTSLVLECVRTNNVVEAKRLQSHMDLHSFKPKDPFLQNRLLQLYAKTGQIYDTQQLFDKMPHRDIFSWNALLSAYCKKGFVDKMREFFDGMRVRDSVSYNTVIAGFVGTGCYEEALSVLVRMWREGLELTGHSYVGGLNACAHLVDLRRGKQVHGRIVVTSLVGNVFVWNALIDMYGKCGEIEFARAVFDRMGCRNVVTWNSMISGYLKNGSPKRCLDLFEEMERLGVEPNLVTASSVLVAYCHNGFVEEATRFFMAMKEKDCVCWTTMIVGYMQNGREEDAMVLFREMLMENVRPDKYTISSVVSVCSRLASLDHGKVVHCKTFHIGIEGDLIVSSALVDMYSKCGEIMEARFIFEGMPIRNVVSWNAMIVGCAQNGRDQEALALYDNMLAENVKPNNCTFVGVLSACSHTGLVECGWRYFRSISDLHEMAPTLDHYTCMVNLLGRTGHMNDAVDLIKSMPSKPDYLVWSTLLAVSRINNDIKHAEMAARHLLELDSSDAGPYIILSNVYAASGRWKEVASLRSLMKDRNIQKSAAYSWIQFNNKIHKFVSDDRAHPQSDSIYKELKRLIKEVKEVGFVTDTKSALHDVGVEEKVDSVSYHSEKLALAFGLISKPQSRAPIRILKNIRVCGDCHMFMKFVSKIVERPIILRDSKLFHHFVGGQCSCKDYW